MNKSGKNGLTFHRKKKWLTIICGRQREETGETRGEEGGRSQPREEVNFYGYWDSGSGISNMGLSTFFN